MKTLYWIYSGRTDAKIVLWTILSAIYEEEFVQDPQHREMIISNIERQKDTLLENILGGR